MQGKVKLSAVLRTERMHCSSGPEDKRDLKASAREKKPGQRIRLTELGLSCKVGCQVCFSHRTQPGTEDLTELLYYRSEHSEACEVS